MNRQVTKGSGRGQYTCLQAPKQTIKHLTC